MLATFSVESYKLLQPDFAQASVIILSQISQQLNSFSINPSFVNASQQVAPQLLTSFEPSRSVVLINVFWFLSLAFSLATASLAMLVKQWLRAYLSNDSTSPQAQVRVRHFRHNALLKWNVFQIASILPSFLQFALALFFIALSIFLHQFHRTLWIVVTMAIALWFAFYGFVLSGPIFASSCPYKTPSLDTFVDSLRYSLHRFLRGFLLSFLPSNLVSIETTQEKEIRTTTEHDADIWNRAETIFFDDQLVKDTVAVWFGKAKGSHVLQCVQEMFRRREPRDEPQNLPDHGHDSVSLVLVDGIMRGIESQAGEPEKFQWHQWMAQSFCILADGQRFCSKEGSEHMGDFIFAIIRQNWPIATKLLRYRHGISLKAFVSVFRRRSWDGFHGTSLVSCLNLVTFHSSQIAQLILMNRVASFVTFLTQVQLYLLAVLFREMNRMI